jgi:protein O-GlcNAc transferase
MSQGDDVRKMQAALSLHQSGNLKKAATLYRQVINRNPDNFYALHYLGLVEATAGNVAQAKSLMARARSVQPFNMALIENYATMLFHTGDSEAAFGTCQQGLQLDNTNTTLLTIGGMSLATMDRLEEALVHLDKALLRQPNHIRVLKERGTVLARMNDHEGALASLERAIALSPAFAEAHLDKGTVYWGLKRFDKALAAYDKAFALKPDLAFVEGARLHCKLHLCDWSNFEAECAHLISSALDRKISTLPNTFLIIPASADDQLQCARSYAACRHPASAQPRWRGERYDHDRIRVAYLSADFVPHPVSSLVVGLFEHHDRSRFEISGISIGPEHDSDIRRRIEASFDHFITLQGRSHDQIAEFIRTQEIDILVDLNGYTDNARTDILAERPAPIQVNFLGYSGTMGADYVDYIVADRIVVPENQQRSYSEKIVHLPDSFLVGDAALSISDRAFPRVELELPVNGFVFCCFNNYDKITPYVFDSWMRILKIVERGVLWLKGGNGTSESNLRKEAVARGVNAERLIFAGYVSALSEHLARLRAADLFLDTLPHNAHSTASHALWAGLPVLTCLGETFAGRVAGSVLSAIGLPELVTATVDAYEALAIELAADSSKLATIRRRLEGNRLTEPLFDTKRFTRNIEAAYAEMYACHQAGMEPAHIWVRSP